jgi:hypothetical protein
MTAATPITLTEAESGAQSLASGTVGHALLAVERAVNGAGDWATAQRLIQQAAGRVDAALHTGLYYGAPAIAFLLHTTAADGRDRYPAARQALDRHVRRLTRTRLTSATQRLRDGRPAAFAEYDLFTGLIGFGALLLHQAPGSDELGDLLTYLVRLAEPRYHDGLHVPGWWVEHDPDPLYPTPGGHANLGMAHGAAGLLALLAHATRHPPARRRADRGDRLALRLVRPMAAGVPARPVVAPVNHPRGTAHRSPYARLPGTAVVVLRHARHRPRAATGGHRHPRPRPQDRRRTRTRRPHPGLTVRRSEDPKMDDIPTRIPAALPSIMSDSAALGFAMSCEPRTGALLATLVASKPGGRILELGTGTGTGSAWLLDGMDADARDHRRA